MSLWFSCKDKEDGRKLYSVSVPWQLIVGLIVVLVLTTASLLARMALQLVISIYWVWRVENGRWWMAGVLLVLWLTAVVISGSSFG
jgi:hypothetical protein